MVVGRGTSAPTVDRTSASERRLRAFVENLLEARLGHPVTISRLRRQPSRFATLFPAEVLTLKLAGGERMSLFLKHLGEEEQSDHPEKLRRDREVRTYERFLGDPELPVARFYGWDWNQATRRYELLLEYVDDLTLNYQGLDHWYTSACRLADLHAHFADRVQELIGSDFLLQLDQRHFREWSDRALTVVAARSTELAARLARVLDGYDLVADLLAAQPKTLVHNDLSPKNVIADRSTSPARICFVDWEMAGAGCGVLDIVHLKYGLDEDEDRKMVAAYCAALAGTGLVPSGREDRRSVFAACELHRTLHRLAHVNGWRTPLETVERWVAEAHQLRVAV
jgi:aminoglycoside phosphotransferase (APT) family kinase protein